MITRLTEVLYANFQTCTLNKRYISQWFTPTTGLLHRNPAVSTYFILVVELLGIQIRTNKKIRGITIGDYDLKSVQFADDMNLFSLFSQESLQEINHQYPHNF